MRVEDVKGLPPGWLVAKETWSAGCQSRVAILRANGRVRSVLMGEAMVRPWGTAREPFWLFFLLGAKGGGIGYCSYGRAEVFLEIDYYEGGLEGGCHFQGGGRVLRGNEMTG